MALAQIAAKMKSSSFLLNARQLSKSQFVQRRKMAKESSRQTIIPPPPPDTLSFVARITFIFAGVSCAAYIALLPENNYDSIGLMGTPGKLPPPKSNN